MKLVINVCFGGFGLSEAGLRHYAKLKGWPFYVEQGEHRWPTTYWKVPKEDRVKPLTGSWHAHSEEARKAYNQAYREQCLYSGDIARDDAELVRTVEELGKKANGECAELEVVEIPDGVQWSIEEYDGNEHVSEVHRTWR